MTAYTYSAVTCLIVFGVSHEDDLVPPVLGDGRLLVAPPLLVGGEKKGVFHVRGGDNLTETLGVWAASNGGLNSNELHEIKGGVKQLLKTHAEDITKLAALRAEAEKLDQKLAEVLAEHDLLRQKTDQVTDRLGWPHSDRLEQAIRPNYEQLVEREFHLSWYNSMVWSKTRWLGTITHQNPMDMWVMQEIMYQVQPEVVLEIGCRFGGSAVIWGMILQEINPRAKVGLCHVLCHPLCSSYPASTSFRWSLSMWMPRATPSASLTIRIARACALALD
jgi:hypothetical protein